MKRTNKKTFFLSRLVKGEYSLAFTFWICLVLFDLIMIAVVAALFSAAVIQDNILSWWFYLLMGISVIYIFVEIPILIGTWRAASNYQGHKIWKITTKIMVFFGTYISIQLLFGLGLALFLILGQLVFHDIAQSSEGISSQFKQLFNYLFP